MAISHRSNRLKLLSSPQVEQLPNNRNRLTFLLEPLNPRSDWYSANKGNIFADFGTLESAEFLVDGIAPRTGEAYANMRLIDAKSTPSGDGYVVQFVYETLTDTWTDEDDDRIISESNGLRQEIEVQVATGGTALPYDEDDVGVVTRVSGGKTLYLAGIEDQSSEKMGRVVLRWSEAGVISVTPSDEGFSLANTYVYVTTGRPASLMSGLNDPLGVALPSAVTWFEPSVQSPNGFPTYTQKVLLLQIAELATQVKVHSYEDHFTVTEPGVMNTGFAYNSEAESGSAVVFPQADSQPSTYRKKGTVDVYLSNVGTFTETEVAYTEENTNWCSISFTSFYNREADGTASVDASWRAFPNYLNSSGTTNNAEASILGKYYARADSYGEGSTTYTTSGVYRVQIEPYAKDTDETQMYLKTVVTFT